MTSEFITEERHQSFIVVRLNRPEKLNSLSGEMILALSDLFKTVADDTNLRAVILTGAGDRAFCAGTDICELVERDSDRAPEVSERGQTLCNLVENCRVPVIAAVNGIAAGGGCELALACHIRIAAASAQFSLPETKLGVIPGYSGTQRLAREIGHGRALDMMLTGRTITAEEAWRFGLVNHIAAGDELLARAEALALEIAALAPLAIRACLEAVVRGSELPIDEGLALETKLFASLFATDDVREGTSAFIEKRRPVFKGK